MIYVVHTLVVKSDLRGLLGIPRVLVKCAVSVVALLLDSCTKFHQFFGYWLICSLQYIDEPVRLLASLLCDSLDEQRSLTLHLKPCLVP